MFATRATSDLSIRLSPSRHVVQVLGSFFDCTLTMGELRRVAAWHAIARRIEHTSRLYSRAQHRL